MRFSSTDWPSVFKTFQSQIVTLATHELRQTRILQAEYSKLQAKYIYIYIYVYFEIMALEPTQPPIEWLTGYSRG
jgi:hypothetical protein